jgi:hypothetical protein
VQESVSNDEYLHDDWLKCEKIEDDNSDDDHYENYNPYEHSASKNNYLPDISTNKRGGNRIQPKKKYQQIKISEVDRGSYHCS